MVNTTKLNIIIFTILAIILSGLGYYFFIMKKDEPPPKKSPESSPDSNTNEDRLILTITENGTSLSEGYKIMPKREGYIQMPTVWRCDDEGDDIDRGSLDPNGQLCLSYDSVETNGFAYVYDSTLTGIEIPLMYTECPEGGHECWFVEKYDNEGTLTDVINKEGDSMLDKMIDDVWNDKWDIDEPIIKRTPFKDVEFKDGQLISKSDFSLGNGDTLPPGNVIKPGHYPTIWAQYFMLLFISMKIAGIEKPYSVVLKIKNGRDTFMMFKNRNLFQTNDTPGGTNSP